MATTTSGVFDIADPSDKDIDYGSILFDENKAREAAKGAKIWQDLSSDTSNKKVGYAAGQERETIGKQGEEARASTEQQDTFKRKDEERDYYQAQRAYRY